MTTNGTSLDILEKGETVHATRPQDAVGRSADYYNASRPTRIANPGTLGLFSFASTTLMLSLYNARARDITHTNVVLGMAIFCGGLAQLLAGMWEFPRGNTFAGTAFTSYGAFWLSFATINLPFTGVRAAFASQEEFANAVGIYLITWFLVTVFLLIAALRKNIAFIALFAFLAVTFLVLAIGDLYQIVNVTRAGGGLGVVTAFIAYYIGLSELLAAEDMAIVRLPLGVFERHVPAV
ncbi:FUN34 transmembrane protein [Ephemerocybe angulata]|uniref:FUN34 transmembrane protein n=1 Tax=Ephemerocybe angulata TaxID=980116 RepID=A0A8H6HTE6_9AGAR|nr:FUN34 transmembrane protein [Tulosesus angulatus]